MKILLFASAISALALTAPMAQAAVVTYSGLDIGQVAPIGTNSAAAQALFLAAAGSVSLIDFESALPAGVSISGGSISTGIGGCGFALCGGNTTLGGNGYLTVSAETATFTFTTPISTFGAYFTGVQITESITFSDGTTQEVIIPDGGLSEGGMSFAGFTDFGQSIVSVTINTGNGAGFCLNCDLIGLDDVLFGTETATAAPEPVSLALLGTGLAGIGLIRRRKAS